ncbi:Cadherin domain and Fibronectin, type III domain and Immunoglobulin-like fold domain and Cadherin-like domain-containing protein [Strongyloides ratti]|uniref:Cadherin domain and Fibronectin, type III domain and Immunoglobulin-like fold domain and Cadherin-like domain-containing protein n=1 Tax=Strongyloides ratti TaxID=34506 RepID=A0A090KTZ3_STRRB|nr:Cadherin domain and Fibronectin, type III domain and Immunoglobulin-like fold domain and Cadherin-like domain-containing protein [Strongyloides ratti]CEF59330.1 Cadherin domain and Fibronectin, type III domain and Immunoglobulin-like fold domain and Cadherin-like domain-containing protein [Strongyloides ratti]
MKSYHHSILKYFFIIIKFLLIINHNVAANDDIYEVRIHEDAEIGSKGTLNEALENELHKNKNCFGQFEIDDVDWLHFDSTRMMFIVDGQIPIASSILPQGILFLMCASNHMVNLPISIHVTRINRHQPTFSQKNYEFYVPLTMPVGSVIEQINVVDHDPIIYNSQISLSILPSKYKEYFDITKNGTFIVNKPLNNLQIHKLFTLQIIAMDYGSPQLFSTAKITIIPVTVSQPINIRVNYANSLYQIFEWDFPMYGTPTEFEVEVSYKNITLQKKNVSGTRTKTLFKLNLDSNNDYNFQVIAIDNQGESRSRIHKFKIQPNTISCQGSCGEGGKPMCYYNDYMRLEQYQDSDGLHCLCYHGYTSIQCDVKESCPEEIIDTPYGRIEWLKTIVNETIDVECPYSSDGDKIKRKCQWDSSKKIPKWEQISDNDSCRKQSSVLIHLGVLANYAQKNGQTISGVEAIQRFLRSILKFPAFDSTKTYFDNQVATHVAHVLDILMTRNSSDIKGNITLLSNSLQTYINQFTRKLPISYKVTSNQNRIQFNTFEWIDDKLNHGTNVGKDCYLKIPSSYKNDVIRSICIKNTSYYDKNHLSLPILNVFSDHHTQLPIGHLAVVGIRKPNKDVNYTCGYFNLKTNEWSKNGLYIVNHYYPDDEFIYCETSHLGIFTLLPENYFDNKFFTITKLFNILPIITNATIIICSLTLLFIVYFQKISDPAFTFLLIFLILTHLLQIAIISIPEYESLQKYDNIIYIIFQICLTSTAMLVAFINNTIYIQCSDINKDINNIIYVPIRIIIIIVASIILPGILGYVTYETNIYILKNIVTINPQFSQFHWIFGVTCLFPITILLGISTAFGVYSIFQSLYVKEKEDCKKECIYSNIILASLCSFCYILCFYLEFFLFLLRGTNIYSLIYCFFQISLVLSIIFYVKFYFKIGSSKIKSSLQSGTVEKSYAMSHDRLLGTSSSEQYSPEIDHSSDNTSPPPISYTTTYGYTDSVNSSTSHKNNGTYRPGIDTIDLYPTQNLWNNCKRNSPLVSLV